jgi:hypothetical protein
VRDDDVGWRTLTCEERDLLGVPFFAKPAHGYAGKGVVGDAREIRDVERCRSGFADSRYLLQRTVDIGRIGERPAYWRVIYVLGEIYLCWWHPETRVYEAAAQWEIKDHGLWPLFELGHLVAGATELECFSVEAARTPGGRYVLVDYVNDQIDLRAKSFCADGVPDEIVRQVAWRIVRKAEATQRLSHVDRESDLREEQFPSVRDRHREAGRAWPPERAEERPEIESEEVSAP